MFEDDLGSYCQLSVPLSQSAFGAFSSFFYLDLHVVTNMGAGHAGAALGGAFGAATLIRKST
jgi:hypothetical protein